MTNAVSRTPERIRLAISTCPNDTFAFHGILENKVDLLGLDFEIQLLDIQQLNDGLFRNQFDVAKASFHAAALLADRTVVLPSGSAIGFGVGPLLLASAPNTSPTESTGSTKLTLCPGEHTTATMLYRLFYGKTLDDGRTRVEHNLFSDIMPALQTGTADFGVCIHEGRFTWQEEGLFLVEDLGTRWETETNSPLPLGGILANRELPDALIEKIQTVIQSSIRFGLANRDETLPTMRKHAQSLRDEVLFGHVDLYVNEWTIELGAVGENALFQLGEKVKDCGLNSQCERGIEIWKPS